MPAATIIPFQAPLPQALPTIEGNLDYRQFREQLRLIDQLLLSSGLENQLVESDLQRWLARRKKVGARAQRTYQIHCRRALRCNIARHLLKEDYRGFAARLADSPLLQRFCEISEVDRIKVPSKSTLQRYDQWWPEKDVSQAVRQLLHLGANAPDQIHLPEAVDLETALMDTTCLKANIHYPVDWVLLRDATRTLMNSVERIRAQGLKHRMPPPAQFITRINTLCIEMTHAWNKADSQRQRKKTLRRMDRLVGTVREHARRYRHQLDQHWQKTQWSRKQAEQVLRRMDEVLEQLPKARRQARQRILKEQPVANEDKILSLYEADVRVIVRRKAGAEVEFGNTLFLAENPQGFILDWELFQQSAPSDTTLLPLSIGRMEAAYGPQLKAVGADRGFDSQANQIGMKADGIYNGVCPRDPQTLRQRQGSSKFKRLQRRRAQTESRIAIFKNAFGTGHMRSKGFENRKLTVTWSILVHNLWMMARLQSEAASARARAA